ncbi:Rrf2 family transcriptional regulator [Enterobacter cancerogenus]|nr:Rrf2 family transcriptional regulator [Enterobacter cancerogenus]
MKSCCSGRAGKGEKHESYHAAGFYCSTCPEKTTADVYRQADPLSKLSELNLSLSYLEQVFSRLKKSGLVEGVRGPGGGYKPVQESYSLGEVIRALGGNGLLFSPAVLDALDAVPLSEV